MADQAGRSAHVIEWLGRGRAAHEASATVLIVDEHEDTRDLYDVWLSQHGFHVRLAATVEAALALAALEPVDVVVTELVLPGGGPGFIRRLRDLPATADAVVIVLTTQTAPAQRRQALAAGADAYVPKPCGPRRLTEVMATTRHIEAGHFD